MRFRKSISIAKGLRLNFSKSGVSATVGGKGISANVGRQGVYLNASLPGTGIYDRKRILNFNDLNLDKLSIGGFSLGSLLGGGKTAKPRAAAAPKEKAPAAMPEQITLELEDDGGVRVCDQDGMPVTDAAVLARIRATDGYRAMHARLVEDYMAQANAETEAFVNIGQLSEDVPEPGDYERLIDAAAPEALQPEPFAEPEPTRESVRARLEAEAQERVQALFGAERKREDYVRTRLADAYLDAQDAWKRRKEAFEAEQRQALEAENARLREAHAARVEMLRAGLDGDRDAVEDQIERWLRSLELPIDFDVDFEYDAEAGVLMADMDLPEIEHLPTEKAVELGTGKLKTKEKTQKELRREYVRCVLGLGMFCASNFFCAAPGMERVLLSAYTQRRNAKTGDQENEYIYSVVFDREPFEREGYQKRDPQDFYTRFKNRMNIASTGEMKRIEPYGPADLEAR